MATQSKKSPKSKSSPREWLQELLHKGQRIRAGHLVFICNICGTQALAPFAHILDRELPTCPGCRSSLRFRSLIAALQERLLGKVTPLITLSPRKDSVGLGMSDEKCYATFLKKKFTYTNTFFHTEPRFDIQHPSVSLNGRYDFIVSADVMEHVPPPIEQAFRNLHNLLQPGGVLVLTVPFNDNETTTEHFPELHQFEILGSEEDRYLVNTTKQGEKQTYRDLVFHGGQGATLEMRVFSRSALLELLRVTGFRDIHVHSEFLPEWGIIHPHPYSVPITAVRA